MVGKRLLAFMIDLGLALVLPFIYAVIFGTRTSEGEYTFTLHGKSGIPVVLLIYLYYIMQEYYRGKTIGKFLFKLKVVKNNNTRLTFIDVCKRHLFDFIEILLIPILGAILVIVTPGNRRIGDYLAKTKVIEEQSEMVVS